MRALSIRQPFAEEILRGIKTVDYRTKSAERLVGEEFYIYAAKNLPDDKDLEHSASLCKDRASLAALNLPTRLLVGTAVIARVSPPSRDVPFYQWHFTDAKRLEPPIKPTRPALPVWFNPF